jgi:hypothetical protein
MACITILLWMVALLDWTSQGEYATTTTAFVATRFGTTITTLQITTQMLHKKMSHPSYDSHKSNNNRAVITVLNVRPEDFSSGKILKPLPYRGFPMPAPVYEIEEDVEDDEDADDIEQSPSPVEESKSFLEKLLPKPESEPEPIQSEIPTPTPNPESKSEPVLTTPESESMKEPSSDMTPVKEVEQVKETVTLKDEVPSQPVPPPTPSTPAGIIVPSPPPPAAVVMKTEPDSDTSTSVISIPIPDGLFSAAPIIAIPLVALVAGRQILTSREQKQKEIKAEIASIEKQKKNELNSLNATTFVVRNDSPPFFSSQISYMNLYHVYNCDYVKKYLTCFCLPFSPVCENRICSPLSLFPLQRWHLFFSLLRRLHRSLTM